jgi:hypothetical protein
MTTRGPKLVTGMSCRTGTWIHFRCTLNAAIAPFLKGSGPSRLQQKPPRRGAAATSADSPGGSAQSSSRVGLP